MITLKYNNFRFCCAVVVSFLSTGILHDKSAYSPVIDIFEN